jgi:hypothetical protein
MIMSRIRLPALLPQNHVALLPAPALLACAHPAVCPPGTFGPACATCPAGSFCPGGSSASSTTRAPEAPVVACPSHMTSPAGSTSQADCVCVAGHGGTSCQVCTSGTFSEGGSRDECQKCDAGQISIEGAPSRDYCSCPPGQGPNCTACPRGTWGDKGECHTCPDGRTSSVGATGPDQCYCRPGTYGEDCSPCLAGSYCLGGKEALIQPCAPNRYSDPGAKAAGECFCVAGTCVFVTAVQDGPARMVLDRLARMPPSRRSQPTALQGFW